VPDHETFGVSNVSALTVAAISKDANASKKFNFIGRGCGGKDGTHV